MSEWIGTVLRYKQTHPNCMAATGYTIQREALKRWANQRQLRSMEAAVDELARKNTMYVEWHQEFAVFKAPLS